MDNLKLLEEYNNYLSAIKMSKVYYNSLSVFIKDFIEKKEIYIKDINRDNVMEYLSIKNYSANSFNTFIKAGRHFFKNFLEKEDNIFNKIKLLKVERKIPDYISEQDLNQGIRYCVKTVERYNHRKINAVLQFMFYSGLRKGEILNLKRSDISLEKNPIEVLVRVPTKGKEERIVYLPPKIRVNIYKYFKTEKEKANAFNLCGSSLDYLVKIFAQRFPKKHISIHTFRHSYAKDLIKNGIDVTIVSKLLGHKNIETTLIYVNPDEEMIKNIYKSKRIIGD